MKADALLSQALPRGGRTTVVGSSRAESTPDKNDAGRSKDIGQFGAELRRAGVQQRSAKDAGDAADDKTMPATTTPAVVIKRAVDLSSREAEIARAAFGDERAVDPALVEIAAKTDAEPIREGAADDAQTADHETDPPMPKGDVVTPAPIEMRAAISQQGQMPSDGQLNKGRATGEPAAELAAGAGTGDKAQAATPPSLVPMKVTISTPEQTPPDGQVGRARPAGERAADVANPAQAAPAAVPFAARMVIPPQGQAPLDGQSGKGRPAGERVPATSGLARAVEKVAPTDIVPASEPVAKDAPTADWRGELPVASDVLPAAGYVVPDAAQRSPLAQDPIATPDGPAQPARTGAPQVYETVFGIEHKPGPLKALNLSMGHNDGSRVAVRLVLDGDDLDVRIRASRPDAEARLNQKQDLLVQALERQGYAVGSVAVESMPSATSSAPSPMPQNQTSERRADADLSGSAAGRQDGRDRGSGRDRSPGGETGASRQPSEQSQGGRSGLYL